MGRVTYRRVDTVVTIDEQSSTDAVVQVPMPAAPGNEVLPRLVLNITSPELAGIDWESRVVPHAPQPVAVVRVSPTRARVAGLLPSSPTRVLQVGRGGFSVEKSLDDVFRGHQDTWLAWQPFRLDVFDAGELPLPFNSISVLHFDALPVSDERMSAHDIGGLGWLNRLADDRQTRLVVITSADDVLDRARRIAARLVARGGPAVVIVRDTSVALAELPLLYAELVHDQPLDFIARALHARRPNDFWWFLGGEREELLRASAAGAVLATPSGRKAVLSEVSRAPALERRLTAFPAQFETFQFPQHETGGTLPMAREIAVMRSDAGVSGPAAMHDALRAASTSSRPGRTLNARFHDRHDRPIPQTRNLDFEPQQLVLQVGPPDTRIVTVAARALIEEMFKWSENRQGARVDLAVTGIDFEVLGDPVQEVWLPREGLSEAVTFNLMPKRRGLCLLRYGIYFQNRLLQSFRLAANIGKRTDQLGPALELPASRVGKKQYLMKLEYFAADLADEVAERSPTLSIVANDANGRPVVSIKGPDLFNVFTGGALPQYVSQARGLLESLSIDKTAAQWSYRFGADNSGTEPQLKAALMALAKTGSELYAAVVEPSAQAALAKTLEQGSHRIDVAQIYLEKSVPWQLLYDRHYDADLDVDDQGQPLAHDACLSLLDPTPPTACGQSKTCPLHPDRIAARAAAGEPALLPETVACARHLWGLRHQIQLPAQQVDASGAPPVQPKKVGSGRPARVVGAFNSTMSMLAPHRAELDQLLAANGGTWDSTADKRSAVLKALKAPDVALVYFYCHATGVDAANQYGPHLGFADGRITAANLGTTKWATRPLVILNGCGTAGFRPDSLSPFVAQLVGARNASGVLGTEVPIYEVLAREVGTGFLRRFLDKQTAGEALLEVRLQLLKKFNPLGLIYTLFAPSDLTLD